MIVIVLNLQQMIHAPTSITDKRTFSMQYRVSDAKQIVQEREKSMTYMRYCPWISQLPKNIQYYMDGTLRENDYELSGIKTLLLEKLTDSHYCMLNDDTSIIFCWCLHIFSWKSAISFQW